MTAMLKQKVSEWDDWIEQARQDARASENAMLIIIRYNNTETFTITEPDFISSPAIILYKDVEIHTLEMLMLEEDSFFFTEDE